jgi:hypothetical protein
VIGFELTANGSNNFKQKRGGWTEGSMMALKILATAASLANRDKMGGAQRGALSSIETSFKKIADAKFNSVCSMGLDFTLFLKRDIKLKYHFNSSKTMEETQSEFLHLISAQEAEMGDQVMIAMCTIIEDFTLMNFDSNDTLILTIDVDL